MVNEKLIEKWKLEGKKHLVERFEKNEKQETNTNSLDRSEFKFPTPLLRLENSLESKPEQIKQEEPKEKEWTNSEQDDEIIRRISRMLEIADKFRAENPDHKVIYDKLHWLWHDENLIEPFIIEKIEYRERSKKTSEEILAQKKFHYHQLKQYKLRKLEEEKLEGKIQLALQRKSARCFNCQKIVQPILNPRHELKNKRDGSQSIIVISDCPVCNHVIRSYGGTYAV